MSRPHGTYAKYSMEACRCPQCREAVRQYSNDRYRLQAYGRWQPYVDAEPARQHVKTLMAYGIGWMRVAELSGVARGSVSRLMYGASNPTRPPSRRIRPETERKLLAVKPTPGNLGTTAGVDSTGTRRRVQALVTIGWSLRQLAAHLGMDHGAVADIARAACPTVYAATAQAVTALYDELWDQPPPRTSKGERTTITKARKHAASRGWAPPAAWDDDEIDDPAALPDRGAKVPRVLAVVENAEELERQGLTPEQVADRLGITVGYLHIARRRASERIPA